MDRSKFLLDPISVIKPDFLVYDEPTSAMDPRHENLFIRKMSSFLDSKTFIVVTQKANTRANRSSDSDRKWCYHS